MEEDITQGMKMLTTLNPYGAMINGIMDIGERVGNWITTAKDRREAKKLQQKIWDREDSLIQRRVADAQLAGINPLAGLGVSGNSQIVSMPDFTPMNTGESLATTMESIMAQMGMQEDEQEHELNILQKNFENEMEKIAQQYENALNQQQIQNAFEATQKALERQFQEQQNKIKNLREKEEFEKNYRLRMAEMARQKTQWETEFKQLKTEQKRRFILDTAKTVLDFTKDVTTLLSILKGKMK